MRKLTLFLIVTVMVLGCTLAQASDRPTGASKICHDIGYLSVGTDTCEDKEVLGMKYYDKEVALADAQSTKNEETNITNVNVKIDEGALLKRIEDNKKKYVKKESVKQIVTWEAD